MSNLVLVILLAESLALFCSTAAATYQFALWFAGRVAASNIEGATPRYAAMANARNPFIGVWLNDSVRDVLCDACDDDTLCSLRKTSRDLADVIAPVLFKTLYLSFRIDTFSKPGRLETFSRVGHHVRDLHFSMEHCEATFLPELYATDGESNMWPWAPCKTVKSKVERTLRQPTESEQWMEHWPPMFQAASNAYQFIRFFRYMPRLRGLTLTTSGQDSQDLYRRSAVDFAVASVRTALDNVDLQLFRRLSLDIHPGALLSLMPTHSYVNSPRSNRLIKRIKKLKITMTSWDFEKNEKDHLKLLDSYIRSFAPSLEKLIFTWDGERGPCPVTLQSDSLINLLAYENRNAHLLFGEMTSPMSPLPERPAKPEINFSRLRSIKLQNASMTAQQLHDFFARHRETLRSYELNEVELKDHGDFEYVVSPLLNLEDETSRWPMEVSCCSQSFTDSGYESPGSIIEGSPIDGLENNLWAGITDEDIYDDSTPGLERKAKIDHVSNVKKPEALIISAKHEKRRVKKRRRMHPKELAAAFSRQAVQLPVPADAPSRLLFGASMLSLDSMTVAGLPSITKQTERRYSVLDNVLPQDLRPQEVRETSLGMCPLLAQQSVHAIPRAFASMKSAPILLQPTVFVPAEMPDLQSRTPPTVFAQQQRLKPNVFDYEFTDTSTPVTAGFHTFQQAPPKQPSTPDFSLYSSPLETKPHETLNTPDTPTPLPLSLRRQLRKPTPLALSSFCSIADERSTYKTPTPSAMLATMIPPLMSPYAIEALPPTPPKKIGNSREQLPSVQQRRPHNPLTASAHLSLLDDTNRLDSSIQTHKETLIAKFAQKYSELSSQTSHMTMNTAKPLTPVEVGNAIKSTSPHGQDLVVATAAGMSTKDPAHASTSDTLIQRAGSVMKKGLRAFKSRHVREVEVIERRPRRTHASRHKKHGRSHSDPTSKRSSATNHKHSHDDCSSLDGYAWSGAKTEVAPLCPALHEMETKPGYGISKVYSSYITRRNAEELQIACRNALIGVDGVGVEDDEDLVIDIREAWQPVNELKRGRSNSVGMMYDLAEQNEEEDAGVDLFVDRGLM